MEIDERKISKLESKSQYFQDILEKIPTTIIRRSSGVIFAIFCLLIVGSRFIKYPDVIESEVLITSATPSVEVYGKTSGSIVRLFKADLDSVKKGEWVLVLNNTGNYKDVQILIKLFENITASNFLQKIRSLNLNPDLSLGEMQGTYYNLLKSIEELELYEQLQSQLRQLKVNSNRQAGLNLIRSNLETQLKILDDELTITEGDLQRHTRLNTQRVISEVDLEQKKMEYLNMKNRVEVIKGTILNSELQSELLKKENTLLDVEKKDLYFKLTTKILEFYNALQVEISGWRDRYVLISPIDGIVNFYDIRSPDQYIQTEQKAFTITPLFAQEYFAVAKLPIVNSGKVKVGQKCTIKLHNFPYTEFGMLAGVVTSISTAPREGFYSVKIQLPKQLKTTMGKNLPISYDLVGRVSVIIEDLTLFDRLINVFK